MKRILAVVLSVFIVILSVPQASLQVVAAPTGAVPVVTFVGTESPGNANVIEGASVKVNVPTSAQYPLGTPPFTIKDPQQVATDRVEYNPVGSSFTTKASVGGTATDPPSPYSIVANFFSTTAQGIGREMWTANGGGDDVVEVVAGAESAILSKSTIKIQAATDETIGGTVNFKVMEDGTGAFARIKKDTEWGGVRDAKGSDPKPMVVNFFGHNKQLTIHTKQSKTEVDPITGADVKKYRVSQGTTFEINFETASSKELTLTVWKPQTAINKMEQTMVDVSTRSNYVILKKDDDFTWITDSFKLKRQLPFYGAIFDITWEWVPAKESGRPALDPIKNDDAKTEGTDPNTKVVTATIHQMEDDVEGAMVATIKCKLGGSFVGNVVGTASIPIIIKGKGNPPYVMLGNQKIGQEPLAPIVPGNDPTKMKDLNNVPKERDINTGMVAHPNLTPPTKSHVFYATMYMGDKNAVAEYAIIRASNPEALDLHVSNSLVPYRYGEQIKNPDIRNQQSFDLMIKSKTGNSNTMLYFDFYGKGFDGKISKYLTLSTPNINVYDTSPKEDTTLSSLKLRRQARPTPVPPTEPNPPLRYGEDITYGFDPARSQYSVTVSNHATEEIQLFPMVNDAKASQTMGYRVEGGMAGQNPPGTVQSGQPITVKLGEGPTVAAVYITVTAENPFLTNVYRIEVKRDGKNTDSALKALSVSDAADLSDKNLITAFLPTGLLYTFEVPYKVRDLKIKAEPNYIDARAELVTTPPTDGSADGNKRDLKRFTEKVKLTHPYDSKEGYNGENITEFVVRSVSESGQIPTTAPPGTPYSAFTDYKVAVRRKDPSADATLKTLEILDYDNKALKYSPVFNPTTNAYEMEFPYVTTGVRIKAEPTDLNAMSMQVQTPEDKDGDGQGDWVPLKSGLASALIPIPAKTATQTFVSLKIKVVAEDERTQQFYDMQISRDLPNNEAMLASLALLDQDDKVIQYDFNSLLYNYNIEVPFETTGVSFTPTTVFPDPAEITLNGKKLTNGQKSYPIRLNAAPGRTEFEVVVKAQDGTTTQKYNLSLARKSPSNDTLLRDLTMGASATMKPIFVPSQRSYKAEVADKLRQVTVTATANHPKATIKINDKIVASGTASEPIDILESRGRIKVVITAQDGRSSRTYDIDVTNGNLINKTPNADLEALEIKNGVLTPKFRPSISTYKVAVKDDTSFVDLVAQAADSRAELTMFSDTREVGDESGNLSEYITDGENVFTIQVVSSDKTVTKDYTVTVYRNDDENKGVLKPISIEEVDLTKNQNIVVDISKYAIVSADIFYEMQKYPDKTLTFVGNDYSLEFKGSDLGKLTIPYDAIYDFSMKYVSPDEEKIREVMDRWRQNEGLQPIYVYFGHHGELPAKATLNMSLGARYQNIWMYWHYFNEERDRIDYNGRFATNNRGTFSIPLTHMSNYMIAPRIISGSENKTPTGEILGTPTRVNPTTGVR